MANWRPDDWRNPYKQHPYPPIFLNLSIQEERAGAYEAGADAMYLAARKKLGRLAFLLDPECENE